MSARYSRSGRAKPQSGGFELAVWYLMRLSGLALFVLVLTHYLILHVLHDPADQTASWIAEFRWNSLFWRAFDWLMLTLVLFHAFMGMRVVIGDYARGGLRMALMAGLYLFGFILLVIGTAVVMTLPVDRIVPGA
jgi:succinate dehydrogenase / fumarate reductase membrane anchor subunit